MCLWRVDLKLQLAWTLLVEVAPGTAGSKMNGHLNYLNVRTTRRNSIARRPILFNATNPLAAFTLVETLISIMIMGMFFATLILGYTRASQRAQWSGYSLAAQAQSTKLLEEFRAVMWDTQDYPVRDDTTNVPTNMIIALDLPVSGTNITYATNTATVSTITLAGGATIKMIVVNTSWSLNGKSYNNTIVDYRAPDQ